MLIAHDDRGGHRPQPVLARTMVQVGENTVPLGLVHARRQRFVEPTAYSAHRLSVANDIGHRDMGQQIVVADSEIIDIPATLA